MGAGTWAWMREHKLLGASFILVLVSVAGLIALGVNYAHESDYWLVAIPGFGTAVGTIGLAGATFRLIQREGQDRENTLTALAHSQIMATEAARARRDARARLLRIAHWQGILTHTHGVEAHQLIPDGYTFDMPKDGATPLLLSQVFEVLPDKSDDRLIATFNRLQIRGESHIGVKDVSIPLDDHLHQPSIAWFTVRRTVAEWVAMAERREKGITDDADEARAWVTVEDGFDDGVTDSYELLQSGCPLRRSPDRYGQWILDTGTEPPGVPRVVFKVMPRTRLYFISRKANLRLE